MGLAAPRDSQVGARMARGADISVHSMYWTELIVPVAAWRKLWSPLGAYSELLG